MLNRRTFLRCAGAAATALSLPTTRSYAATPMPARPIPGTDESLPVIGLGNSIAFQEGDLPRSRELLALLTEHGGSYVDTLGPSRDTLARIMKEDESRDELFIGTYIEADDYASGRMELSDLRDRQAGGPLDLVQTHVLRDLPRRWAFFDQYQQEGLARYTGIAKFGQAHFETIMQLMDAEPVDVVQINYSLLEPEAAERVLPMAADKGVAIVINRPFVNGRYFEHVRGRPLPGWAAEFDCDSWAQFSLKFILAHPAVNCVLTETANPLHAAENLAAAYGRLPDDAMQRRMLELVRSF